MRIIMLGKPGTGKGTHAKQLARETGVAHISSGEYLRAEIDRGTELGRGVAGYMARGDLVPDDLIFDILRPVIVRAARETGGFILDGFPRTLPQALRAAQLGLALHIVSDAAVYLTAPDEILVARMLDRAKAEGRTDDTPAVIRHRLDVFADETAPLVEYYRGRGILVTVDANRPLDAVQADIRAQLTAQGVSGARAGESA
jgi:adenylate kinase